MALYESTGEVRIPKKGELYLNTSMRILRHLPKAVTPCNYPVYTPEVIMRKLEEPNESK